MTPAIATSRPPMRYQCPACGEPSGRLHRPGCELVAAARLPWGFVRRDECEHVEHEQTIRDLLISRWPEAGEEVWYVGVRDMHLVSHVFSFGRSKRTAVARAFRHCEYALPEESTLAEVLFAERVPASAIDEPAKRWLEARA